MCSQSNVRTPSSKTKADDYLHEFGTRAEQQWLRSLVESVIASRGTPKGPILDRAFEDLLVENGLKEADLNRRPPSTTTVTGAVRGSFLLRNLKHECGVNALVAGADIPFHNKLTVIYGKNGSGKSGFVRILKRLAGSKMQEEIWQNVRTARTTNRCKARITYTTGGPDILCEWNGESGVSPFRGMGIFDGKCVPVYLTTGLTFSYQPYGFELFQALSEALRGLHDRLTSAIRKREGEKPSIDFCNADTLTGKFLASVSAKTSFADISKAARWDQKTERTLRNYVSERSDLLNLDDKTELFQTRLNKLSAIEAAIMEVQTDLSLQNLKLYSGLAKKFAALKKKQVVTKGRTLEDYDIAQIESDEWQQFIDAGEEYINVSQDEDYPDHDDACVYCQQTLSKTAQRLIHLYRELYLDEESSDLEELKGKLDEALNDLDDASYTEMVPYTKADFTKLLPKAAIAEGFALLVAADTLAKQAAEVLRGKKTWPLQPLKIGDLPSTVAKARTKVRANMKALDDSRRNLLKKSRELDHKIAGLQDVQKLFKNRSHVEKYLASEQWIAKATALGARLNTKPITDLGKAAWNELVSKAFQSNFQSECKTFRAPTVSLAFRGEYGSQLRQKTVEGLSQIDQILSEGEQKAVALADFLAEQSMQSEKTPIVFDDPATSFDHERKERIAERIVQESGDRQVVVFTHDLMFASYLYENVLDTKGDIDSSKAAFHDLRMEAAKIGIVTANYYQGAIKFDAAIKKVEDRMPQLETLSGEKRTDGIRNTYGLLRRAVEKAVEERIFGRVISRWSDQIQLHNVSKASLSREKLDKAKQLHEKFSRYIEAHNQSNEMIQHAMPELDGLKTDVFAVRAIAVRK